MISGNKLGPKSAHHITIISIYYSYLCRNYCTLVNAALRQHTSSTPNISITLMKLGLKLKNNSIVIIIIIIIIII